MRKGTKIALAASAFVLVGAIGISHMAIADYRGSHGAGHFSMGHKGWSMMGRGHRRMGRMMERFDVNQDGKLTQEELDGARKTLLGAHDGDKDGKLSLAEYEKLWLEVKRRKMTRSFQRTDKDGDASVTLEEFLKPFSKLVERMDRNNDGVLDSQDRRSRGWRGRGHSMDGGYNRGREGDEGKSRMDKREG